MKGECMTKYELDETFKELEKAMEHTQNGAKFKIKLLDALSKGFPIDYECEGDTLLHKSLSYRLSHAIQHNLLDCGADVNIEDHNGMNALLLAACNFRSCYSHGKLIIPSYYTEILAKTEDVDKVPRKRVGTTALGLMCMKFCTSPTRVNKSAIKMLLDAGADISAAGDWFAMFFWGRQPNI